MATNVQSSVATGKRLEGRQPPVVLLSGGANGSRMIPANERQKRVTIGGTDAPMSGIPN